jgi:two-component system cell cycle sensor histidine kinase/response regulator CckA
LKTVLAGILGFEQRDEAMFFKSVDAIREADKFLGPYSTATILLVEDEERVREVMELTLRLSGYRVLAAENAAEALEILKTFGDTIHLMVTDFALPLMNGAELAARFKRVRPGAKVLFISGFPKHDVLELHESTERAAPEFLQKPFTPEALEDKVREMLEAEARDEG